MRLEGFGSRSWLKGVGPAFVHYLKTEWRDFVAD